MDTIWKRYLQIWVVLGIYPSVELDSPQDLEIRRKIQSKTKADGTLARRSVTNIVGGSKPRRQTVYTLVTAALGAAGHAQIYQKPWGEARGEFVDAVPAFREAWIDFILEGGY